MAAGYEDCNDANHLRIDPALRLAVGKDEDYAASQSMLSRLENEILGNEKGIAALDETLQRSIEAFLRKKSNGRLILDMDSTEDPAHGRQEGVADNGHFGRSCYHPLFCFTSKVVKVYNARVEIENRIKEGKITLRWDKTSCTRFEANQARLKMGVLAYNLLHMLWKFYIRGEGVRRFSAQDEASGKPIVFVDMQAQKGRESLHVGENTVIFYPCPVFFHPYKCRRENERQNQQAFRKYAAGRDGGKYREEDNICLPCWCVRRPAPSIRMRRVVSSSSNSERGARRSVAVLSQVVRTNAGSKKDKLGKE